MKPTRYEKYTMLLVEWLDITQDGKWHNKAEMENTRATKVKSIGFFLKNYMLGKKWVLKLASSVTEDGDSDVLDIPFGCINFIKEVRVEHSDI